MGTSNLTVIVTLTVTTGVVAIVDYNGGAYLVDMSALRHLRDDQYSIASYHINESNKIMNQPSSLVD
jgi:hypothetical protein